jgi:hypothetical protein
LTANWRSPLLPWYPAASTMRTHHAVPGVICVALSIGCNSSETKECHQKMVAAQNVVNTVESSSVDSLTRSIQMIRLAESSCKQAGRDSEVKELSAGRERLEAHLVLVEQRAERKKTREALTPEQLEQLVRDGDPNCPKGQARRDKATNKEIRCIGPQPVEMNWEQAKKYFASRNFHHVPTSDDSVLTFESGAERYVFRYAEKDSSSPATCIIINPRPGTSWQETVARSTGVAPEKLRDGGTVGVAQGKLPLSIDNKNQVARLGVCPR